VKEKNGKEKKEEKRVTRIPGVEPGAVEKAVNPED
jgi:hypothetical protein